MPHSEQTYLDLDSFALPTLPSLFFLVLPSTIVSDGAGASKGSEDTDGVGEDGDNEEEEEEEEEEELVSVGGVSGWWW